MKKRIISLFLAIALVTALCVPAMAAQNTDLKVRVNGYLVEFPDGQPYIDENNRTMVPIRFVAEALDAEVEWDGPSKSAIINKGEVCVVIAIGESTITVTEAGETRIVTMDTCAVLNENRTFIPVRFVAEALGVYVDYSNAYKTVGIYLDELTAEEVTTLRSYDYTVPTGAIRYAESKAKKDQAYMDFYYGGKIRESFGNYANAREYLYQGQKVAGGSYVFPNLGLTLTNAAPEEFYDAVVREAKAALAYNSERMTVELRTDNSCIYHADNKNFLTVAVRGIIVVKLNVKPTALNGTEAAALARFGFTQLYQGIEMHLPIDIHMNTVPFSTVNVNTYAPLTAAY